MRFLWRFKAHMSRFKIYLLVLILFLLPEVSFAHCPLCVGGVLAITFLGYELGVKKIAMGFLIGALAVAFSEWMNRLIKKKIFKGQDFVLIILTFILSYLTAKRYILDYYSLYLKNFGIDKFIFIDKSLITGSLGGILVFVAPYISRWITQKRGGKTILFQRIIVTLILLIAGLLIFQYLF